jgi:hypothetical protein
MGVSDEQQGLANENLEDKGDLLAWVKSQMFFPDVLSLSFFLFFCLFSINL